MLRAVAAAAGATLLMALILIAVGLGVLAGKITAEWLPRPDLLGFVAVVLGCVYAGIGVGLAQRRNWALHAGLGSGMAGLAMVPIGTIVMGVGLFMLYRARGDYDLVIDEEPADAAHQDICPYCARGLPESHPLRQAA